jgi:hypothetical protein
MASPPGFDKIRRRHEEGYLLNNDEKAQLRRWGDAPPSSLAQGSVRELSLGSMSKLQDARSTEHEARSKVASMRRMLQADVAGHGCPSGIGLGLP